jgi:hypothetical protein
MTDTAKCGFSNRVALHSLFSLFIVASSCGPSSSGECVQGERGCACQIGSVCESPAVCVDNLCSAADDHRLIVSGGENLRACELVLRDGATRIVSVEFDPEVQGQFSRRGKKTAIAFISAADRQIDGRAVHVRAVDDPDGVDALRIDQSECFDRNGNSVAGAAVTLSR